MKARAARGSTVRDDLHDPGAFGGGGLRIRVVRLLLLIVLAACAGAGSVLADPAPFDLAGPTLDVRVTHVGKTLPISQAPNLSPGDQIWIRPELPQGQSIQYLMVVVFLRGATDPPPEKWFHPWRTWDRKPDEALNVTVPEGAQQALVFLAPKTGGDFNSLVKAVRGRPGAFVRASQDINQASLDKSRLDAFVAAIRHINQSDPGQLKTASPQLARSLNIKLDAECLTKVDEAQAPCLTQGQESLVLSDGQSQSLVQALTTGDSANLIQALSSTPQAGYGYLSPYISSVMDIAHILDSFHTAQYQYIPALGAPRGEQLALLLNYPPSFKAPMSVLVVALPAVASPSPPPLRPVDPKAAYCLTQADLTLPAEGAPLVFSTGYAHDLTLRVKGGDGRVLDLPVKPDAEKGGLVVDASSLAPAGLTGAAEASIQGYWGFSAFSGPSFPLQSPYPVQWRQSAKDQQPLIAGRDNAIGLEAANAACVDSVTLKSQDGETQKVEWKSIGPDRIEATLALKDIRPGPLTLLIKDHGGDAPDELALQAFPQPADLDSFIFHAGDHIAVLKGRRLGEVTGLKFASVPFKPERLEPAARDDQLTLVATDAEAASQLAPGRLAPVKVALKDGRTVQLEAAVEPSRPSVTLISRTITPGAAREPPSVELMDKSAWPADGRLTFSMRAQTPAEFSGDEQIEVANDRGLVLHALTPANGLTLADPHVLVAQLETGKALGPTAFGALQFRIVKDGAAGDWQPLATLVRTPKIDRLQCPDRLDAACQLTGSDLFLISALSDTPTFARPITVPDGFTGMSLEAPRPEGDRLYVKLRDDPDAISRIVLPPAPPGPKPQLGSAAGPASAAAADDQNKVSHSPPATVPSAKAASPN